MQSSEKTQLLRPSMPKFGVSKAPEAPSEPMDTLPSHSQGPMGSMTFPIPLPTASLYFEGPSQQFSQPLLTEPSPHLHLTIRLILCPKSQERLPHLSLVMLLQSLVHVPLPTPTGFLVPDTPHPLSSHLFTPLLSFPTIPLTSLWLVPLHLLLAKSSIPLSIPPSFLAHFTVSRTGVQA